MKFLRGLLSLVIAVIVFGSLGYTGWHLYKTGSFDNLLKTQTNQSDTNMNMNMSSGQHGSMSGMQSNNTSTHGNMEQMMPSIPNAPDFNALSTQNMEKIAKAIDLINQAVTEIGMDPYSKVTVGSSKNTVDSSAGIVLYPSGSSSVTITNQSSQNAGNNTNSPIDTRDMVYNQNKLQQVHSGIYTMSQGIALVNGLNDDLVLQSADSSSTDQSYQTYMNKYNEAYRNRIRLNNALGMLAQASTLVNVNPYAPANGYEYDKNAMEHIHTGITRLAEGVLVLNQLNDDFRQQMILSLAAVRYANSNQGMAMTMPNTTNGNLLQNINGRTIIYIVLIVLVIGLIIAMLGAISDSFKNGPKKGDGRTES